jgi:hypothetical protein
LRNVAVPIVRTQPSPGRNGISFAVAVPEPKEVRIYPIAVPTFLMNNEPPPAGAAMLATELAAGVSGVPKVEAGTVGLKLVIVLAEHPVIQLTLALCTTPDGVEPHATGAPNVTPAILVAFVSKGVNPGPPN